jgi:hypothetical protein
MRKLLFLALAVSGLLMWRKPEARAALLEKLGVKASGTGGGYKPQEYVAEPSMMPPAAPLTQTTASAWSGFSEPAEEKLALDDPMVPDVDPDVVLPPIGGASGGLEAIRTVHESIRATLQKGPADATAESRALFLAELEVLFDNHARLESEVFYPWLLEIGLGESYVRNGQAELDVIEVALDELAFVDSASPEFDAKLLVFKGIVLDHLDKDDSPMFEFAEHAPPESIERLKQSLLGVSGSSLDSQL